MKLKQWQNIFHVIVSTNWIVKHVVQIKNGILKHVNVNIKINVSAKKIIVGILAHVFVRIVRIIMGTVSTKKTNTMATKKTKTIATNFTITASINCHSKKLRDCYIYIQVH